MPPPPSTVPATEPLTLNTKLSAPLPPVIFCMLEKPPVLVNEPPLAEVILQVLSVSRAVRELLEPVPPLILPVNEPVPFRMNVSLLVPPTRLPISRTCARS